MLFMLFIIVTLFMNKILNGAYDYICACQWNSYPMTQKNREDIYSQHTGSYI